jgi:hypothetical protein
LTAVSVVFDGASQTLGRLNDAEALGSVWLDSGGAAAVLEPDTKYQGTNSVSEKCAAGVEKGLNYTHGANVDMATTPRVMLYKHCAVNAGVMNAEGATGGILELGSGGRRTNYYRYYVAGNNTYPPSRSWLLTPIDPNVTAYRDATVGSAPTLTQVVYYGWVATFSTSAKSENIEMDAVDVFYSGTGLTLTGGSGTDADGTFASFLATDQGVSTNRWGIVSTGIAYDGTNVPPITVLGTLTIGSATETDFTDVGAQLVFPDGRVNSGFFGLKWDLQNASSAFSLTNCTFASVGKDNLKRFFDTELQVTSATDIITITAHGFLTGQAVLYSKGGDAQAIGLTDATEYFVRAVSVDTLTLHATRQQAVGNTSIIALTASTSGNGRNHSLQRQPYTTPHFTVTGTAGTMAIDGCTFRRFGDITFTSKPTVTGCNFVEPRAMAPGGASIRGCVFDVAMTVEGEYLLSDTVANLEAIQDSSFFAGDYGGHAMRMTGTASQLDLVDVLWSGYGNDPGLGDGMSFDTTTGIDDANDEIDFVGHGFTTGEPVYYSKYDPTDGSLGTAATGPTDGALYYARAVTADAVSLHYTRYGAVNNANKVGLTATGTETHTLYSANAAVVNNTGGDLNVSVSGGDVPSIRNIGAATTTVVASVPFSLTNVVSGSTLYVYALSGGSLPAGTAMAGPLTVTTDPYSTTVTAGQPFRLTLANASGTPIYAPMLFDDNTGSGFSRRIEQQLDE